MTLDARVTWIIGGGIAHLLAQGLIRGLAAGCMGRVAIGILGTVIGGWLLSVLNTSICTGLVNKIIAAFAGAAVLLVVIRVLWPI